MKILEYALYVYFLIQLVRWIITIIYFFRMSDRMRHRANIKFSLTDNILWVAPLVYFLGGLK